MPTFSILWDSADEAGLFIEIKDHLLAEKCMFSLQLPLNMLPWGEELKMMF